MKVYIVVMDYYADKSYRGCYSSKQAALNSLKEHEFVITEDLRE